tara:strand:+ start:2470 stop:3381 length:912 start_codon:yes stop_codon:yes gene_type:complete
MGFLRKLGKKIAKGVRKIGRKLKKGLGKLAKAFGKLGPLGTIGLSVLFPGLGGAVSGWISSALGPVSNFLSPIIKGITEPLKGVMGKVANTITGALETGINAVSKTMGGTGTTGSNFRNWISKTTNGFVKSSEISPPTTLTDIVPDAATEIVKEGSEKVVEEVVVNEASDRKRFLENLSSGDKGIVESFRTSQEADTMKKLGSVSTYGQTLQAGEDMAAQAEEDLALYNSSKASSYALDVITPRYTDPMQMMSFINTNVNNRSASDFVKQLYQIDMPEEEALKVATQSNTYGFNFENYLGLTD